MRGREIYISTHGFHSTKYEFETEVEAQEAFEILANNVPL